MNCVYTLIHIKSKKFYYGTTTNFDRRKKYHFYLLSLNKHYNPLLQELYNDDPTFEVEVLWMHDTKSARKLELELIQSQAGNPNMCNRLANGCWISDIAMLKLRTMHLGKKKSLEARARMSAAKIGSTHSDETKAKMSLSRTGKKHSTEWAAQMGQCNNKAMRIDGVEYKNATAAAKAVGLSVQSTLDRGRSTKWPTWEMLPK